MVERIDPGTIAVLNEKLGDKEQYIESDFRIRNGICPNGHGLMMSGEGYQTCTTCNFWTNKLAELKPQ